MQIIDQYLAILGTDTVSAHRSDAFEETVSGRLHTTGLDIVKVNGANRDRHHGASLSVCICADVEAWFKRRRGVVEDEALLVQNGETQRCNRKACNAKTRVRGE